MALIEDVPADDGPHLLGLAEDVCQDTQVLESPDSLSAVEDEIAEVDRHVLSDFAGRNGADPLDVDFAIETEFSKEGGVDARAIGARVELGLDEFWLRHGEAVLLEHATA